MNVTQRLAPNDISDLVPEFKVMLQATNRSPWTIEAYLAGVEALRGFLVERGMPTAVDAVVREHVEAPTTEPTILRWSLLLALASLILFVVGRIPTWDNKWHYARMLIPPLAFFLWTMLQPISAFDAVGLDWKPALRGGDCRHRRACARCHCEGTHSTDTIKCASPSTERGRHRRLTSEITAGLVGQLASRSIPTSTARSVRSPSQLADGPRTLGSALRAADPSLVIGIVDQVQLAGLTA